MEARLYERWERSGYFHEDPDPARPPFIICMPPPNVTARAHIGHASTYTPMDVLVRFHRMLGDNADWLPGTDHAAIATEAVLVRQLAAEGTTRERLGRERYLQRAWQWARDCGGTIEQQFCALGFGPDWPRSRFTMDENLSAAVRRVFVSLYRDGLIYRGKRLINWDPQAQTTISDAEVEHEERDATLWYARYPFAVQPGGDPSTPLADARAQDDNGGIVVATTRPETMLGDVAIAVHPNDKRYRSFIGKQVLAAPLLTRSIPIVADEAVDPDFGTGAVKVTPAHDATDYEIGRRQKLPMPSVLDKDARVTAAEIDVGPFAGLDRMEARKRVVEMLREKELLVKEEPYRHAIATSERTGAVIEPLLSEQWFVRMAPLARLALDVYHAGRLRFTPERYGRIYEQWLENIRDWNISRQVWWGHQLPVWYTKSGEIVVAEGEEEALGLARERYGEEELTRDPDTLDTWFSSGIWPFSILGWPQQTQELACWYPSQVLVTGYEIIFLWVARMVMLGLYVMNKEPFADVVITPLVFDSQGRKMSKSLGNAIDPMEMIDKYGADAFRVGMLRQLRLESQDVRFHEARCEEARNFNNKIWNVTRYTLSLNEGLPAALTLPETRHLTLSDRWILSRLRETVSETTQLLERYDFGEAIDGLWRFLWYEFCDWYVETTKMDESRATRAPVLSFVLNHAMRLLHPFAPFISEEVWLTLPHDGDTIVTSSWPDALELPFDAADASRMEAIKLVVVEVRNRRAELGIAPRETLAVTLARDAFSDEEVRLIEHLSAAKAEISSALPPGVRFAVAMEERHLENERRRLDRERERLRAEVARGESKLRNRQFVEHAKPDVVAKEREKLEQYRSELARVEAALTEVRKTA